MGRLGKAVQEHWAQGRLVIELLPIYQSQTIGDEASLLHHMISMPSSEQLIYSLELGTNFICVL
jgi:hypothetical protein